MQIRSVQSLCHGDAWIWTWQRKWVVEQIQRSFCFGGGEDLQSLCNVSTGLSKGQEMGYATVKSFRQKQPIGGTPCCRQAPRCARGTSEEVRGICKIIPPRSLVQRGKVHPSLILSPSLNHLDKGDNANRINLILKGTALLI